MVHALEEIRRILKPGGVLIDIHPVAEASPMEIHQAGRIDLVGNLLVQQWYTDYELADNALAEIVERGLFAIEREGMFDSSTYYGSVAEMGTSLKEAFDKYARDAQSAAEPVSQAEALVARAAELMQAADSGAELIVRERAHISRFKPA